MTRHAVLAIGVLLVSSFGAAEVALEKRALLGGKVELLAPRDFTVMSERMLELKYPSARRPTLVLTNPDGSVNLAFNHTASPVLPEQLPDLLPQMERMFSALYPSAVWFRQEIVEINGRRWIMLDLRTPAVGSAVRNLVAGTSLEQRLLIVSFNTTQELEAEWLPVGMRIIDSLKVVE